MSKTRTAAAALLIAALAPAAVALAAKPHYVSASAARSGDNLVVSFKEAGLGNNQLITEQASAFGTATYLCINGGGHNPSAANKRTVSGLVTRSGNFRSDKNGSVTGSLTINPPGPGDFSCPSGQRLTGPLNVSYTSVSITDTTNNVSTTIPGTF